MGLPPTVNMPAAHCMVMGSILNKLVSEADDEWEKISKPMQVYALAGEKHGRIVWDVLVGCILWDIFPEPEAVLYLTEATQREFVAEFDTPGRNLGRDGDPDGPTIIGSEQGGRSQEYSLQDGDRSRFHRPAKLS